MPDGASAAAAAVSKPTTKWKAETDDPSRNIEAPGGANGPLERITLEDGDVRLARVRRPVARAGQPARHQEARREQGRRRRVRPCPGRARGRVQAVGERERARPELL